MYQRYYDGYGEALIPETVPEITEVQNSDIEIAGISKNKNILGSLAIDDILLIGILLLMLSDDCDDKLMLIIIGFLFVSGLK